MTLGTSARATFPLEPISILRWKNGRFDPLRSSHDAPSGRPDVSFRYKVVDFRDLDGERLLASERVGDNVIAILTRLRDRGDAVREVVRRISELEGSQRELALEQLIISGGIRRLEEFIEREARKVPLLDDIMDNKVLGREYKRGLQEGELTLLRRQIEKRFGAVPNGTRNARLAPARRDEPRRSTDVKPARFSGPAR
ncbi:MAG: hypothetical protein M3Y07_08860 [Acidobacteriota bacterium]|nr:hypothetical protein [Acidobacteriota bacterium]